MKVLLIDPPVSFLEGKGVTRQSLPLSLASVAAYLTREGCECRLLLPDTKAYSGTDPWGELRKVIVQEDPDIVGVTALTATLPAAKKMVEIVQEALGAEVPIVMGGPHATARPKDMAKIPGVRAVVQGEGEESMAELVQVWRRVRFGDIGGIAGVYHQQADGVVVRGPS